MNKAQQHAANMERARVLALIPFGIALNLGLGTLITALKVPLYLDAVATVAVTLLAGFRAGAVVGVASNLIGGVLVNPVLPWYCGTQFLLAAYTALVALGIVAALLTGRPEAAVLVVPFALALAVGLARTAIGRT